MIHNDDSQAFVNAAIPSAAMEECVYSCNDYAMECICGSALYLL